MRRFSSFIYANLFEPLSVFNIMDNEKEVKAPQDNYEIDFGEYLIVYIGQMILVFLFVIASIFTLIQENLNSNFEVFEFLIMGLLR